MPHHKHRRWRWAQDTALLGILGVAAVGETAATIIKSFTDNLPATIVSLATLFTAFQAWRSSRVAVAKVDVVHTEAKAATTIAQHSASVALETAKEAIELGKETKHEVNSRMTEFAKLLQAKADAILEAAILKARAEALIEGEAKGRAAQAREKK